MIRMNGHNGRDWLAERFGAKVAGLMRSVNPVVMEAFREIIREKDIEIAAQEARIADLQGDLKDMRGLQGLIALLIRRMGGVVEFRQGELRETQAGSVMRLEKTSLGDGDNVEMRLSLRAPDPNTPATIDLRPGS